MCKYLLFSLALLAHAQRAFTTADYQHAEKFMTYNVASLVFSTTPFAPRGNPTTASGTAIPLPTASTSSLVDPARATRGVPAFDHAKLAVALSKAAGVVYGPYHLPFQEIELSDGYVRFTAASKKWKCDVAGTECVSEGGAAGGGRGRGGRGGGAPARNDAQSPDKQHTAFIKNDNLWMRDAGTNKETQLTFDGVKDYGYATDNAGWSTSRSGDPRPGLPIPKRSRPFNKTSARSAKCIWSTPRSGILNSKPGNIPSPATRTCP